MGLIRTFEGRESVFLGNLGIGVAPSERLSIAGNLSASGDISAKKFKGTWDGIPLNTNQVVVESIDLKTTNIAEGLVLKADGNGGVVFEEVQSGSSLAATVEGTLTVNGDIDIVEFTNNGSVLSKNSVFSYSLTTGSNTAPTFLKADFKTAKYIVTLSQGTTRTAFEILVVHNGSDADGTTYGIVDAQATSLLSEVNVSVSSSTIDLVITTTGNCTAIINGVAHY
tara:strand:+ start:259 stop:933 length:675 start_codon:yes stop_codon:yes gene_type:complete